MGAYLLRRLLLIVPTLIGIMLVNFTLTQFVPGGPIEQIVARVQGEGDVFRNIAGGGDAGQGRGERALAAAGRPHEVNEPRELPRPPPPGRPGSRSSRRAWGALRPVPAHRARRSRSWRRPPRGARPARSRTPR